MDDEVKAASLSESLQQYPRLEDALRRCCALCLGDLPEEALRDAVRLCEALQAAHWFYLDEIVAQAKSDYPRMKATHFFSLMIEFSVSIRLFYSTKQDRDRLYEAWSQHLSSVPRRGAFLLDANLEKCLMVQSRRGLWTPPCGKLEHGESDLQCAVREVSEETGLDVEGLLIAGDALEDEGVKLFVASGLPQDLQCRTRTKQEIAKVAWISLKKFPGWTGERSTLRFYNVQRFVPKLKRWISSRRSGDTPSVAPSTTAASDCRQTQSVVVDVGGDDRGIGSARLDAARDGTFLEAACAIDSLKAARTVRLDLKAALAAFDDAWRETL
eukprot:TRINITY_DN20391_c0_g1_i1.p1 TRINITY_DN20391_c0_g1~~TRINITY_DN20391_c0_g1_i1.p1  ORF type:complete len:327 (+),score=83.78 TRINITY_DN20391_c0_g1_i1:132-1112(+)